jgi:hypothetical protein
MTESETDYLLVLGGGLLVYLIDEGIRSEVMVIFVPGNT